MPEVSVIIPTFNRDHLLEKAICSVLQQTYENFELIIVDDNSKDNTSGLVSKIKDKRLKYIKHEKQKGGSESRNTGVAASSGKYLAFLDDDDEWLPDKLQLQIDLFKQNPDAGLVYSGYYYVEAKTNSVFREFRPEKKGMLDDRLLQENCVGTTSTAVVRKDCFEDVGGFDANLRGCQDWDLWIRIARRFPIDYVAKPLVRFLNHDVRITHDVNAKIQGKERLLDKIFPLVKDKPKVLSNHLFVIGYLYCAKGEVKIGRARIFDAIKLYPFAMRYYKYFVPSLFGATFYKYLSSMKIVKSFFQ